MYKRIMWIVVVCAFCIHPAPAMAQTTGAIYGFVKDTSGAVVPGATVVAKNTEVADLHGNRVLCYSDPQKDSYGLVREVHRGDTIAPLFLPNCTLKADILLP